MQYYTRIKRSDLDIHNSSHLLSAYNGITGQVSVLQFQVHPHAAMLVILA